MRLPKWVTFLYNKLKGETDIRCVIPLEVWWMKTDWYPTDQWFLKASKMNKHVTSNLAMNEISVRTPISSKDE